MTAQPLPSEGQRGAIEAPLRGPHLVRAGAGTGKTFTLVERAIALAQSPSDAQRVRPRELLVVTFTNKAASEIATRLNRALRASGIEETPTCSTFHALGSAILKEFAAESHLSPDVRAVAKPRARAVFRRAFKDLLEHRIYVDPSALPLLDRLEDLELSLAEIALRLRDRGLSVDEFEARALAAARELRTQTWGQLWSPGKRKAQPRVSLEPKLERSPLERANEVEREERNVHAVAALFRRFDDLLREEALVTFGDLLAQAAQLVRGSPAVATALRKRWKHALVDEFQDTNPLQVELLRAIFGQELVPVMAVGDMRQAIYAFNGADPSGIVRFGELRGCVTHTLVENRRSVQQILDAANAFLLRDAATAADPAGHAPLVAVKGAAEDFPLRVQAFGTGNLDAGRALEAQAIAAEIGRLVASGTRPRDIAILLRGWRRARVYVDALHERGIPAKTHGGVGFLDAPEIRDALAWLRLVLDPTDRAATVRVLQSPTCGLSDGTLVALAHGAVPLDREAWSEPIASWLRDAERERLLRTREILRRLGHAVALPLSHAVAEIVAATGIDLAYAAVDPRGADQTRANLAKLVRLATAFERDRPAARAVDFVRELDERLEFDDDEREADFGDDEVSIMTAHGAKGLEWEVVFIANVSPASFPSQGRGFAPCAVVDERSGALALRYGVDGSVPLRWTMLQAHDEATGERTQRSGDERKAEEARLFYVAMTRAKARLYVSGANGRPPGATNGAAYKPSQYLTAVREWAQEQGLSDAELAFGSGVAPQPAAPFERATQRMLERARAEAARERLRRLLERERSASVASEPVPPRVLSYSAIGAYATCPRLARYRYLFRLPDLRDEAETPLWTAEGSDPMADKLPPAVFGTIAHRVLELCARARIAGESIELGQFLEQALLEEEREVAPALAARILTTARHGLEALEAFVPREPELRFDATVAGNRVTGYIDLVAEDTAGYPIVIDYKTGNTPESAYRLQLTLYRRVLRDRFERPLRTGVLRLSPHEATFTELEPFDDAVLDEAIRAAARLDDDTPRRGVQCRSCPYAGPLCREGTAEIATV